MDCVSKKSVLCAGVGNEVWKGMCSNCADVASRKSKVDNSLSGNDWKEGMAATTELFNQGLYYDGDEKAEDCWIGEN